MGDFDLAINNGIVVNVEGRARRNVGVRDGRVVALSEQALDAARVIDANNLFVLPGAIDCHVHFLLKQGQGDKAVVTEDDYATGPMSAAHGGVTMFIDYAIHPQNVPPSEFLAERIAMATKGSCIDFAFHAGIVDPRPDTLNEIPKIMALGIPSFKFFTTYRKWGFAVDLGFFMAAMQELYARGGMACLHAEQDEILEWLRAKHAGEQDLMYHAWTRPDFSEEISIVEACILARETRCPLYIVHLTSAKGLHAIRRAQADGVPVKTETCPHYLAFDERAYARADGVLYTMTPPLRAPGNSDALWQGLADGSISALSSDHNALGSKLKQSRPHFLDVPPGIPGVETLLPFAYSEGVARGRISLERMVELVSTAPAHNFGVPNKGAVRVGYDADLVIFDPHAEYTMRAAELHSPAGFTIFEGQTFKGRVRQTIARGEVIVDEGKFV